MSVEQRIKVSSRDFLTHVWPAIGMPFGELIPVETVTKSAFADRLDKLAGVDNWLVGVDGHMRGLASRVQYPVRDSFDTFTIRVRSRSGRRTEYDKRKAELSLDGVVRPHYVCQAYVRCVNPQWRSGHPTCEPEHHVGLLAAAIATMRDVIGAVDARVGELMKANPDGSQGFKVPWSALANAGKSIRIWRPATAPRTAIETEMQAVHPPRSREDWADAVTRRPPDWRPAA